MDLDLQNADTTRVTFSKDSFGFKEVLESFAEARRIVVVTYHIDLNSGSKLLKRLRELPKGVQVTLITSIPGRWDRYYGQAASRAKKSIQEYLTALDPKTFHCSFEPYFCFENHAKIIATESVAYIGSQNFADTSHGNFECGVIIRGKEQVAAAINPIVERLCRESECYLGHARQKYLVHLSSIGSTVRGFLKQADDWVISHPVYGGDTEDYLDPSLAALNPIPSEFLASLVEDADALFDEISIFEEIVPALDEWPHDALLIIGNLAGSDDELDQLAKYNPDAFIRNKLSKEAPAPDDMDSWSMNAWEEEEAFRQSLYDNARVPLERLTEALEALIDPFRKLYLFIKDARVEANTIDNTGE